MTAREAEGFAVDRVDAIEAAYAPEPWAFAIDQAEAIDRHWQAAVRQRPLLFDGRVLLQTRGGVVSHSDGTALFRAVYTDVAFKAFLAWRDFGHPDRGPRNGFGMAALQAADGAFVLGEMGGHTANAGRVYFPSGTPDLGDVSGNIVDIAGSIRRELAEETGLDPAALAFAPRLTVLQDAVRVCFMQPVRAPWPADALAARITATLDAQRQPELARLHVVRSPADITPAMPPFVAAYLRLAFAEGGDDGRE